MARRALALRSLVLQSTTLSPLSTLPSSFDINSSYVTTTTQSYLHLQIFNNNKSNNTITPTTTTTTINNIPYSRLYATFRRSSSRNRQQKQPPRNLPLRNNEIKAEEVRLVYPEGEKPPMKTLPLSLALEEAQSRGLDLVLVSPNAEPPVARLMEWDKVVYSLRQKEKAAEKAARESKKLSIPKEVRIGCHIAEHDLLVKVESMKKFLSDGHTVKLVVTFKGGREIQPARETVDEVLRIVEGSGVVKDPRHLMKPQMNQWVVQVGPVK